MTNSPMPKQSDDELDSILSTFLNKFNEYTNGEPVAFNRERVVAKQAIYRYAQKMVIEELETLEADSDCAEDGCGLDAELLRTNFLSRIMTLKKEVK